MTAKEARERAKKNKLDILERRKIAAVMSLQDCINNAVAEGLLETQFYLPMITEEQKKAMKDYLYDNGFTWYSMAKKNSKYIDQEEFHISWYEEIT